MIEGIIERYADLVADHPFAVLAIVLTVTAALATGGSRVDTVEQNTEDFLPDTVPSIAAFETIEAEFGNAEATSYTILIETDPQYRNSNEVRDVRDPRLLRYISTISDDIRQLDQVTSVSSPAGLFTTIPSTEQDVQETLDRLGGERWQQYISTDFTAARIEIQATGISAQQDVELAREIRETVGAHPEVPGTRLTYTGQTYIDEAFQQQSNRTMAITSGVSLLGVLLVVILLFGSIYYGLTALLTLIFGIAAGYGVFGYLGLNMSPATSGAISIGVGIAIDFGIQPVARYREERGEEGIETALEETFKGIVRPMTLGVIAALLGFASLSTGKITFLADLGILLSLTTLLAYIAAFTAIPPVMIIYDRHIQHRLPSLPVP